MDSFGSDSHCLLVWQKDYDATGTFEATEVTVSAEQNGKLMQFDVTEGSQLSMNQQVGLIDTVQLTLKARQLGATSQSIADQRPDVQKRLRRHVSNLPKPFRSRTDIQDLWKMVLPTANARWRIVFMQVLLKRQLEAQISSLGNSTARWTANQCQRHSEISDSRPTRQPSKCHVLRPSRVPCLKTHEQGEFAAIGKPLFKIADTRDIFPARYITSAQLEKVKLGQRVTVMTDYGDKHRKTYDGTVAWISDRSRVYPEDHPHRWQACRFGLRR